MATVDSLDIQIQASAQKASTSIDSLVKKLDILAVSLGKINGSAITGLANGVNRLSVAMQGMKNIGTADFTRLSKNIEKLGNINVAGLNSAASSLSHISRTLSGFESASASSAQLGEMAKNIAKLGNKSVQTAITNIPLLATAMKDLMQTLSTAPRVSQNIIDMTNALANFTQQGSKVSVVSGTLVSGLNRSSKTMNNAKKSSMSLAAAFGKFYATYFLLIRGTKKLWGSIQSSFDYLEVLNYFDAAFGQVAENADLSQFEKMGYESADAYYVSFAKRAEELTQKMSGFTVGENGLLQSTGAVSLGLDPSQLMNYQAMFGQMSSSMGVSSETALKLSQALTEIGADLASVKNLDFESVWNDMASGLAGMSRTLDKYGVNIRNVNLQQKLMELGIDANIQALNQNDKALLRAIILLENTKYAWGDLADTINQPANQLRLIEANFQNLSRTIGNLFLPLVQTVLPYVNALVIAVQRLFAWLGNLIGIDISDISTSIGGADMGDILDQTDDLESGLGGAKKAADKLNKSLRQFDELKVINTKQDDGGAGSGVGIQGGLLDDAFNDAFTKYQQAWDNAFAGLENRAQEIAYKIEKAFEPIKKIIQDFAIGDFFQAGKDVSALAAGIFNFFADAIDKVDWYGIGQKIGDFLAGIDWLAILKSVGNLIWQALKAAFELYVGAFSSAPLETALISLVAFPKLLKAITASKFITGIGKLWKNFKVWGEKIQLVGGLLSGNKNSVSDLVTAYPKLAKKVEDVKTAFSKFFSSVKTNGFWKTVDGGITNIRNNLGGLQKAAIVAVAGFAEFSVVSDSVEKLTLGTENWLAEIGKIAGVVAAAAGAMYVALGPAGLAIAAITGVVGAVKGINDAINELQIETMFNALKDNGGIAIETLQNAFGNFVSNISGYSDTAREKLSSISESKKSIQETADSVGLIVQAVENGAYGLDEKIPLVIEKFNQLLNETKSIFEQEYDVIVGNIMGAYADIITAQGGVVPEIVKGFAELRDETLKAYKDIEKQMKDLEEQLENGKISNEEFWDQYIPLYQKTTDFEGGEKIDEATKSLEDFYGALNLSDYIDGTKFLSDDFAKDIEDFSKIAKEGKNSIIEFGSASSDMITDYVEDAKRAGIATEKYSEWILYYMNANEEYVRNGTESINREYQQYMDVLQKGLLEQVPSVVEKALEDYDKLNPFVKMFRPKAEYVKGVLSEWEQSIIAPASSTLKKGMEELGINGSIWVDEEASKMIDGMFSSYISGVSAGFIEHKDALRGDWRSFAEKTLEGVPGASKEVAEDTVEEFNESISNNMGTTDGILAEYANNIISKFSGIASKFEGVGENAMKGLSQGMAIMKAPLEKKAEEIANGITKAVKTVFKIHSPSRVMFELGDYTMQGFQNGMENLYQPILASVKDFSYDVAVAPVPLTDMYSGYQYQVAYTPEYGISEYPQGYSQNNSETNALLRRQNELLERILAKPNLSNSDIFNAAQTVYKGEAIRRYGGSDAFDPVWG